jgi:predicted permease
MTLEIVVRRLYRRLSKALPAELRQSYGADLAETTDGTAGESSRQGYRRLLLALPRLLLDLVGRVIVEHVRDALRDGRYAVRVLLRAPGFSIVAVVCLALGIGLAGAMTSQIQATVFRPVPGVSQPRTLVRFQQPISLPYFRTLHESEGPFAAVAAYMGPVPVVINHASRPAERVWAQIVTPEYFQVLGASISRGQAFDLGATGRAEVVVSHRYWRRAFGGDPALVGRTIRLNGHGVTVLGIAASDFLGASPTLSAADVWIPTTAPRSVAPELARTTAPHAASFDVIGRLRLGVTIEQAEAEIEPMLRQLEILANDPRQDRHEPRVGLLPGGRMIPIRDGDLPRAIGFPLALVALVLLMASSNVANMLLSRSAARQREMAVRLSLGAGPGRVVRQLLTESVILTTAGGLAGALVGLWLLTFFESLRPMLPEYGVFEVQFDWRAFSAATGLAGLFVIMFGLAPARRAGRQDISLALKPNGSPSGGRRRAFSLSNILVFQQVTASVLLVLLTAFIVIGWQRAAGIDPGFRPEGLYLARFDPVRDGHSAEHAQRFVEQLRNRLRARAEVADATVALTLPSALATNEAMLSAKADFVAGSQSAGSIRTDYVGAGFFRTIGAVLIRGREFTTADEESPTRGVVVSATLAERFWPGRDAIGQPIELDDQTFDVIGVVGDLRAAFPLAPNVPVAYRAVSPELFANPSQNGVIVLARISGSTDAAALIRRESRMLDESITGFGVSAVTDDMAAARFLATFATLMYGGMGVFGLVLAAVGLGGVTAHAVARRRREIGIRMALGATRGSVLWLVLRESSAIIAAGTVTGLGLAVLLTRALSAVIETLAETTATTIMDPLVLVGGPALLATLALIACYVPARESTRIDPTVALRTE